jgi:imidazolonepropionase-like amidohydrolase
MNVAVLTLATSLVASPASPRQAPTCQNGPIAFVDVSVLSMLDSTLEHGQTVLVRDGKVVATGAANLPPAVCRIEARGKVLLPGLADMHAHMSERDIPLFLANGVTLVRELNGTPSRVTLRDRIASSKVLGPRLIVGSPLLSGTPIRVVRHRVVRSVDDAYAAAQEARDAGYDFLKVYDGLTLATYDALVQAGSRVGLPLVGHIPAEVGLQRVIDAGQHFEHMDKIAWALAGHATDSSTLADLRRLFGGRVRWITPTVASLRALSGSRSREYDEMLRRPEVAYMDSGSIAWWRSLHREGDRPADASPFYQFQIAVLKELKTLGNRFLLGTDTPNPLMVPGFSVHDELQALVRDAGFTPYEALLTATRNVGEFLSDSTIGVVRPGAVADLLLVEGDPLTDLATLRQPSGVMVRGRWLDRDALHRLMAR